MLKAVGGEVQEQYIALQRRLEINGLPSAPSPIPSVTDSDISSIGPVRRGTVLRRPSRSSSGRSFNANDGNSTTNTTLEQVTNKDLRSCTPDVLQRASSGHINSDTFTYASGYGILKQAIPEPLPRTTSLNQTSDDYHNHQNKSAESPTMISPCYVNPLDLRADTTIDSDDTLNRYTPPMMMQHNHSDILPSVHQKKCGAEATVLNGQKRNEPKLKYNSNKNDASLSRKRKAPLVPPNPPSSNKNSISPLSSSTSSLSSASSGSSSNGKPPRSLQYRNMKSRTSDNSPLSSDPEYQNVPRRSYDTLDPQGGSEDGDYERDMVVYEAITLGNDMIELVSRTNSSGSSSQASSANRNTRNSNKVDNNKLNSAQNLNGELDNYVHLKKHWNLGNTNENNQISNVRKSVKHYENLVIAESDRISTEIEKQNRKNKTYGNSKDLIEHDNDSRMKSAESSLSLDSQNTVKENNILNRSSEDRASPEGRNSDEIEIVPSRQPQMPSKTRPATAPTSYDPITLFEFDSPTETSDTETFNRNEHCSSPRTIETESTRSFGYIQPDKSLRRRDTLLEHTDSGNRANGRKKGLRRSESFQAGDGCSEIHSNSGYADHRRGSTELLINSSKDHQPQQELYINGRTFIKYAPHDVLINNEVNELLTAALNRRQCRSVEDRLDQWLEEDLRRHNPENLKQPRNRLLNKKRDSGRSSSSYDDNRILGKFEKNNNKNKNTSQQKQSKNKSQQKRFSSSDLIAFNGFINPSPGFIESDYGSNFMLNKPTSKRKTEFLGDKAEFGVHAFPAQQMPDWAGDNGRWGEADPAIPTPDYGVTPAGTLNAPPAHHILDMPSGLY